MPVANHRQRHVRVPAEGHRLLLSRVSVGPAPQLATCWSDPNRDPRRHLACKPSGPLWIFLSRYRLEASSLPLQAIYPHPYGRYPQMYPRMTVDLTVPLWTTKDKNSSGYWSSMCDRRCPRTSQEGKMAEEEGFEPPIPFQVRQFSRLEPSTTRPLFLFEVYYAQPCSAKDDLGSLYPGIMGPTSGFLSFAGPAANCRSAGNWKRPTTSIVQKLRTAAILVGV
jgi:hypothetical protein